MKTGDRNLSALETLVGIGVGLGAITASTGYAIDNETVQGVGYGTILTAGILYAADSISNYISARKKSQSKLDKYDAISGSGG